ncbi:PREDICTED: uncharacterized protein LOC105565299 isoform X2 [Vollenhovia emeryi]|uniref:uncharacterized protein LOC105565299 isoform X2 n=1 Tax=Vollenhovia emeryi TaxID=411798 RepID=UPI0005F37F45|nr:PREDICTED: uncharacterized protein LOC105565299 isoform X2 [Vollenhovia emeryi]
MAKDNARPGEESGACEAERKLDRSTVCPSRPRDQRGAARVKDKPEEGRLPTPPPDPQCPPVALARDYRSGTTSRGPEEEEEDLTAYLGDLGASPFEGHSFDYDTMPNSATSAMGGESAVPFTEEAFEHLDRLCALTEQILELRTRSSEYFRRVRGLERAKVQRNANRRLEIALANGEELQHDFADEDTGFAESLLDAMLSNCRDATSSTPRRSERSSVRSSASSRQRSRSLVPIEQNLGSRLVERTGEAEKRAARNAARNGGQPKVSKWTRVKAAFKWERAYTNDLADIAESDVPATTSPTSATRYLRIPDTTATGSWSTGSALSPCTSEVSSPSTPIGRVSSASSSNDEVFDDSRKSIVNYPDRQSPLVKDDKKRDDPDRYGRSLDRDTPVTESADSIESHSEANRGKPLIRIVSDADATMHATSENGKDPEASPKRPPPTLTITIPSNEEEIRSLSSPESMSPLPSSAQDSGGSSPQRPRVRQDILSLREFKRQYSTIEEAVTPAPKIQQQDSKWNKVRRAFLTNATFSVPPSPIRVVAAQSFTNDDTRRARSCSESIEDLGKTVAGTNNNGNYYREARRDYQALREKFGAEFHRKLIEWERLKGPQGARNGLPLNEERLAPEFRKKLQDWKRAKKGRRSSAAIEQQRVSRRRLTDWQLWRSSSKPEPRCYGKNQGSIGSRGSCASIGSAGSLGSDGKQHLCEDFIKRMETWRRMSEAACRSGERPKSPTTSRLASNIDETEFLALEKLLLLFGQRTRKELRESDARQLNDCFDGDSRFMATSRGVNCGNEVLIRTSVGSYRFEGISREFTRKLYDWEKYRGISPRSSTFRLLGPGYTPFAQDSDEVTSAEPSKNHAFHWTLKRSKSDGSVFEGSLRDESITLRRSASLQSLASADKLEDDTRMNVLPVSNNSQGIKDAEDTAVEDSEPEAMIVDIEDVIEETASPLAGVRPHQTPVYCVAASETTSIAVPLGTVTSSHEPSPVFLVKAEEDEVCERWDGGKIGSQACSSENSPSPEYFPVSADWHGKTTSLDEDKPSWEPNWRKESKEDDDSTGWTEKTRRSIPDSGDSVKSDRSIEWNRDTWDESDDEANRDSTRLELPSTSIYESTNGRRKQGFLESDNAESTHLAKRLEISSTNAEEFMDPPLTCKGMDETCKDETCKEKIENLADESSNNERTGDAKSLQDDEDDEKAKRREAILSTDCCAYQATRTIPSLDRHDSKEISSQLSNLNSKNSKDTSECHGVDSENEGHYESCGSPELQTDADRHYEILTFKTEMCGDTMDSRLYELIDCNEVCSSSYDDRSIKGTSSSSRLPEMKKSNLLETPRCLLTNSTVQTIPITVARDNKARCLERILINEQTLNKIIVPTACAESGMKPVEKARDRFTSLNRMDETAVVNNYASKKMTRDHQVECVKKDSSSTRNVFVKTKRMIFGPFRRSEDRPSSRKQSDSSVDGRLPHSSKSKSKSRSASPKLCRQDALLRVSLSLPWPLRSTSKENEVAFETESRRSSESKTEGATIQEKNSPYEENSVKNKRLNKQLSNEEPPFIDEEQDKICQSDTEFVTIPVNACSIGTTSARVSEYLEKSKTTMTKWDRNAGQIRGELKYNQTQDDGERSKIKCSQVQIEEKRERNHSHRQEEGWQEVTFGRKQNEAKQQDENHARCDAVPSDLMHKLKILSDVAAKREGRTTAAESSVVSSLESRSSRIRRAKESFLSRRGGPFCRSVMEPAEVAANPENPWRRTSTTQISTEVWKSNGTTEATAKSEEPEDRAETTTLTAENETVSVGEDKVDARQTGDRVTDVVRSDSLVKSASAGMINVDPDTFDRLVTAERGCESLPRAIAKRRDSASPLAKIVGKLKLSRLIRTRNVDGGNMSTITTLCRQSLLIDMRNASGNRPSNEREIENDLVEDATDDDDHSVESSKAVQE